MQREEGDYFQSFALAAAIDFLGVLSIFTGVGKRVVPRLRESPLLNPSGRAHLSGRYINTGPCGIHTTMVFMGCSFSILINFKKKLGMKVGWQSCNF